MKNPSHAPDFFLQASHPVSHAGWSGSAAVLPMESRRPSRHGSLYHRSPLDRQSAAGAPRLLVRAVSRHRRTRGIRRIEGKEQSPLCVGRPQRLCPIFPAPLPPQTLRSEHGFERIDSWRDAGLSL